MLHPDTLRNYTPINLLIASNAFQKEIFLFLTLSQLLLSVFANIKYEISW